jgi:lysozyme family protein
LELRLELLEALNGFASDIRHARSPYTYNVHAATLFGKLNTLRGKLNDIYSETVFVSK